MVQTECTELSCLRVSCRSIEPHLWALRRGHDRVLHLQARSTSRCRVRSLGAFCVCDAVQNSVDGVVLAAPDVAARLSCSQTIFSRRAGVAHRIHGVIIAVIELALAIIPYSLVQYLVRIWRGLS